MCFGPCSCRSPPTCRLSWLSSYTHMYTYIYIYIYLSLSLSLSVYLDKWPQHCNRQGPAPAAVHEDTERGGKSLRRCRLRCPACAAVVRAMFWPQGEQCKELRSRKVELPTCAISYKFHASNMSEGAAAIPECSQSKGGVHFTVAGFVTIQTLAALTTNRVRSLQIPWHALSDALLF